MDIQTQLFAAISKVKSGNLPKADPKISEILTIVFGIIGALAFLMVVVSGLRFVLSSGEPDRVAKARSALIYSLVGLLIAVSAQAIIYYVANALE